MNLKPQDLVVLLKLVASDAPQTWSYAGLAHELSMSPSEVHAAVRRAIAAQLMTPDSGEPVRAALEEFLLHGARYAFFPDRGGMTRGVPTAHAAPPLARHFPQSSEPPPVWRHPEGPVRGLEFSPLYRSVPEAAMRDEALYELLALVDAIRGGRARERQLAAKELRSRLRANGRGSGSEPRAARRRRPSARAAAR